MERAIFEFMFSTGCRIGEIVTLVKNHINWSDQSAIVRGKGDKGGIIFNLSTVNTYNFEDTSCCTNLLH